MPHLYVAITAHGYGHLAQAAPLINDLKNRIADLEVTLQGDLPADFVRQRIPGIDHLIQRPTDVGMVMDGPLQIDWAASRQAYADFYEASAGLLEEQLRVLEQIQPDLVLADVPWMPLMAAQRLGIANVALCSLNWVDILEQGVQTPPLLHGPLQQMRTAYASADLFVRPDPSMPMEWLENSVAVGPLAKVGVCRGVELREQRGLAAGDRMALLQFGGVQGYHLYDQWPRMPGVHWLVPAHVPVQRNDFHPVPEGFDFVDVLASCDLLVTKPGYGSFSEAAVNGIPVLSIDRRAWPEAPWLIDWLQQQVPLAVHAASDSDEVLRSKISSLLSAPPPSPVAPTGAAEVWAHLRRLPVVQGWRC